jgi:CRP-like cAMP-binding protein
MDTLTISYGKIHAFYKALNINVCTDEVRRFATALELQPRQRITLEPGMTYFVERGLVSMSMQSDSRVIGNTIESMPIGLLEHYCPVVTFDYICLAPTTLLRLPMADFETIFFNGDPQKTRELVTVLSFMVVFMVDIHVERRSDSGYHTIKPMLFRYLYRRTVNEDENEGIANFIIRRTNLSRSYVYRVLSDLREGGYITVKKGKLISVDRRLPEDY